MSDRPPLVEFDTPYSAVRDLAAQRERLRGVADDIRGSIRDVGRYGAEGARAANIAAAWAATLMVADILKIGLSAMDRRANVLFKAQDRAVERANKVLKLLGRGTITTREELMKSVDPNLRGITEMTEEVRKARQFLKDQKVNAPKHVNLLLDLGLAITEDSVLIVQAGQLQQQAYSNAAAAQRTMHTTLSRLNQRIMLLDQELTRMVQLGERLSRTA